MSKPPFSKDHPAVIAAVEAGGTSFVVAICHVVTSTENSKTLPAIVARQEFDSSHDSPSQTLEECCAFLRQHKPPGLGYHALGIASFGPLGVHAHQPAYGKILSSSPKAHWRNVDLLTPLKSACQGSLPLKIKVDTDVNAPAMAEHLFLSNPNISSLAYVTVGTGVGVGLVVNHRPVHGRMHPEGGHVPVQPLVGDTFGGYSWGADTCPFGGKNTVEGLASSVALTERLGGGGGGTISTSSGSKNRSVLADLSNDDPIWDHAANALANLCATLLLTLSMEIIVLGGGLMNRAGLLDKIRQRTLVLLNGYLELPAMDTVIVTSRFGASAGLMGTIVLAQTALLQQDTTTTTMDDTSNNANNNNNNKRLKQEAFLAGLWHGTLVGMVGTALVCKYWFLNGNKRK
jgi:fructokinase